jgi:hypothetical protein
VKTCFVAYGIDVFLAHDDLEPSTEWALEIQSRILTCDVFVPLLTKRFPLSKWTDQETGMAVAAQKLVVPVKAGINPYGFIASRQAVTLDPEKVDGTCRKIVRAISRNLALQEPLLDGLIDMFAESFSFEEAGRCAELIGEFDGYSPQQVRRVLLAMAANDQIHRSFKARRRLEAFLAKYGREVDPALLRKVKGLIS